MFISPASRLASLNEDEKPSSLVSSGNLRRFSPMPPRALFIGASTGGQPALIKFFQGCGSWLHHMAVAIVLHMPDDFIADFAAQLRSSTGNSVRIAAHGDSFLPGSLYLAPGDRHLRVVRADRRYILMLSDDPPIHSFRPAVDPLFASAGKAFGREALAIVLTGMGRDGLDGGKILAEHGGSIMVQDEASSVVWGMPRALAEAGLASALMPPEAMGATIGALLVKLQRKVGS